MRAIPSVMRANVFQTSMRVIQAVMRVIQKAMRVSNSNVCDSSSNVCEFELNWYGELSAFSNNEQAYKMAAYVN